MPKLMQVHFMMPQDQLAQIDKAAAQVGQNRTDFFKNAALAEMAEINEAKRLKRHRALRMSTRFASDEETAPTSEGPAGLGLADVLAQTPAPVVTNENAQPAVDPISRLADAIVSRLEKKPDDSAEAEKARKDSVGILFSKLAGLLP